MIQTETIELSRIMNHWGLTVLSYKKIKDVFKVKTESGFKNLKVSPLSPKRLLFVHQAILYLQNSGFQGMYPIIPASDGRTYVSDGRYAYSLFDWIEGRQCEFGNLTELQDATRLLAEFHQKTSGFIPPDHSNMRNRLGKCLRHFEEHYQDLLDFKEIAAAMPDDPFAKTYLNQVDFFLPIAARAIEKLRDSSYPELVKTARQNHTFCHGDPAARNFILTPDLRTYMIDFDSCRLDLPVMDLIKFARRVLKKYRWKFHIAKILVDAYHEVNSLTSSELEVMKAVFYFPQKFWRMSTRYFHHHDRHSPERALEKLTKYVGNRLELTRFQTEFDHYEPRVGPA
jgi:CotS family spore coat protein